MKACGLFYCTVTRSMTCCHECELKDRCPEACLNRREVCMSAVSMSHEALHHKKYGSCCISPKIPKGEDKNGKKR